MRPSPAVSQDLADKSASLFAALGDPIRLRLVDLLCESGPTSISRLSTGFDVTRQAITKHLQVMEEAGLAHSSRRGRESVWELDHAQLDEARIYLGQLSERWDEALERLRGWVEQDSPVQLPDVS